jgi:uncharacterized protein (TIGR03084 family)
MQQAIDLREEGEELYKLLIQLDDDAWESNTPFKNWRVNDVVAHLHTTDRVAVLALRDADGFRKMVRDGTRAIWPGTDNQTEIERGPALREQWRAYLEELCDLLEGVDPSLRVPWFGPDMGARMFATARQMETWAHGQDIYDLLHVARTNTDRIKNISVIGVRTFGWTFANRGMDIPGDPPYVRLHAPSGALWEWNEPSETNFVAGSAVEFCHVVTQGRNLADTNLTVVGDTASQWMSIAQCFAGGPVDPPAAGARTWTA